MKEKLNSDLKQALRDRDKIRASCIRLVLSAVQNTEIAKRAELEETDILGVIAKEAKQRKESIKAFKQGNRQDLVAQEEAELAILMEYLPKQMSRDEIITAARKVIAEAGAQGLGDKGKVMGKLIPQLKGRAEGSQINAVVSELLG
ncbi:MAG: GatB/YqeY domain-containing protein [Dehalococcoidales bacterium]|nr:GatB/YqeY domain-containing protein [Dehalococcoidales bacterium]